MARLTPVISALLSLLLACGATAEGVRRWYAAPDVISLVPADPGAAAYRWPLDGPVRVVRAFDPPARPWLPGHRGVDLAVEARGARVRAVAPGVVRFAGQVAGRGVVSVRHGNGLVTTYEPVAAGVSAGTVLSAGAPLGTVTGNHPGCPAVACLHWGLRRETTYLDPLALLGMGRVRLLPRDGVAARWAYFGGRRGRA